MMNITLAIESGRNRKRRITMKLFGVILSTLAIFTLVAGCIGNTPATSKTENADFIVKGILERLWADRPPYETVNGNWVWKDIVETSTYFDGDLEGTSVQKVTQEVNPKIVKPNIAGIDYVSIHIEGTFTGTVKGKSGTFSYTGIILGGNEFKGTATPTTGYFREEHYTIINGTSELSNLCGTFGGTVWCFKGSASQSGGSYVGTLRFKD